MSLLFVAHGTGHGAPMQAFGFSLSVVVGVPYISFLLIAGLCAP
jgi:hypothetical protein